MLISCAQVLAPGFLSLASSFCKVLSRPCVIHFNGRRLGVTLLIRAGGIFLDAANFCKRMRTGLLVLHLICLEPGKDRFGLDPPGTIRVATTPDCGDLQRQ